MSGRGGAVFLDVFSSPLIYVVPRASPTVMAPRKTRPAAGVTGAYSALVSAYTKDTPARLKLLDAFLVFLVLTGVAQFVYCVTLSDYPFNSFLAGYVPWANPDLLQLWASLCWRFRCVCRRSLRRRTSFPK